MRRLTLLGFIMLTALVAQGCKDKKKKGEHDGHRMGSGDRGATGPAGSPTFKPEPPKELPPPDTFVGEVRIINIYAEPGGKTQKVEVWARRSFTNGPAKLVDGLDFGQASPWFKASQGSEHRHRYQDTITLMLLRLGHWKCPTSVRNKNIRYFQNRRFSLCQRETVLPFSVHSNGGLRFFFTCSAWRPLRGCPHSFLYLPRYKLISACVVWFRKVRNIHFEVSRAHGSGMEAE